jgi:hypothetical protein
MQQAPPSDAELAPESATCLIHQSEGLRSSDAGLRGIARESAAAHLYERLAVDRCQVSTLEKRREILQKPRRAGEGSDASAGRLRWL